MSNSPPEGWRDHGGRRSVWSRIVDRTNAARSIDTDAAGTADGSGVPSRVPRGAIPIPPASAPSSLAGMSFMGGESAGQPNTGNPIRPSLLTRGPIDDSDGSMSDQAAKGKHGSPRGRVSFGSVVNYRKQRRTSGQKELSGQNFSPRSNGSHQSNGHSATHSHHRPEGGEMTATTSFAADTTSTKASTASVPS